jgi:hypothetical protein
VRRGDSSCAGGPLLRPEIQPYESPAFPGKLVTSRAERREDLKRAGCIAWEPGIKEHIAQRRKDKFESDLVKMEQKVDETVRDLNASGRI